MRLCKRVQSLEIHVFEGDLVLGNNLQRCNLPSCSRSGRFVSIGFRFFVFSLLLNPFLLVSIQLLQKDFEHLFFMPLNRKLPHPIFIFLRSSVHPAGPEAEHISNFFHIPLKGFGIVRAVWSFSFVLRKYFFPEPFQHRLLRSHSLT